MMYCESDQEVEDGFSARVKHNFRTQLLLCLKGKNWTIKDISRTIYSLVGYKCHKVVKYGDKWSHIHIRFEEEGLAQAARTKLEILNPDLSAVVVDDLLREWYNFEMTFGHASTWTMTVVDTVGSTPQSLNFLTENIVTYLFQDFGNPYLLPYTAALKGKHVQMAFYSMSEALAACMAFGQWYKYKEKLDQFCYRVRINPAHREAFLIRNCDGNPEEAFKLGYFVEEKRRKVNEWCDRNEKCSGVLSQSNESNNSEERPRNPDIKEHGNSKHNRLHKNSQSEKYELVPSRTRRHKRQQSATRLSNTSNQSNVCTSVPLPFFGKLDGKVDGRVDGRVDAYIQGFVTPVNMSPDFLNNFSKFTKSYAEVVESHSKVATESRMLRPEASPSVKISEITADSSEDANSSTTNKPEISSGKEAMDLNRASDCGDSIPHSKNLQNVTKSKKHTYKRRVFEQSGVSQMKT